MQPPILSLESVSFWYRRSDSPILHNLSFVLSSGETLAVVGASGSGKTTLLRLACGLLQAELDRKPDIAWRIEGLVCFNDEEIERPSSKFAYTPQHFTVSLAPWLSVYENIALQFGKTVEKDVEEHIDRLLRISGLYDIQDLNIRTLSGGQQQRVALCRALASKPAVLFLDEPFANLDHVLRAEIVELLREMQSEMQLALLLVTHDLVGARAIADRVLGLRSDFRMPEHQIWSSENLVAEQEMLGWLR